MISRLITEVQHTTLDCVVPVLMGTSNHAAFLRQKQDNMWNNDSFLTRLLHHYTEKGDWIWSIGAVDGKIVSVMCASVKSGISCAG